MGQQSTQYAVQQHTLACGKQHSAGKCVCPTSKVFATAQVRLLPPERAKQ